MPDNDPFDLGFNRPEPGDREGVPSADFRGLRADVGRITQQPEFDLVRRRARRLRTRRQLAVAGAGLAVVVMLGAAGLTVNWPSAANSTATATRGAPSATPLPPKPQSTSLPNVRQLYPADANHIYVLVDDCERLSLECQQWLMASEDGGQTWQPRLALSGINQMSDRLRVAGPTAFMLGTELPLPDRTSCARDPLCPPIVPSTRIEPESPSDPFRKWRISNDAGATWQDLIATDTPVASAPPSGSVVWQLSMEGTEIGRLYAVDPETARVAPLATQPPVVEYTLLIMPLGAGVWVEGLDPTTRRPATAVSHDGGASWAVSVFETEMAAPVDQQPRAGMYMPDVTTADGQVAYAMFATDPGPQRIYRSTDGGRSWQRSNPDAKASDMPPGAPWTFVLADGRHVLANQDADKGVLTLVSSTDGKTYRPLTLTGLPPMGLTATPVNENLYLYQGYNAIYRSEDGLHWQPLAVPR